VTLAWIIAASLTGGVLSVLLASSVLLLRPGVTERILPRLISFSTGALLGAALLGMVPHAQHALPATAIGPVLLGGLLVFFTMEKLLVWRHCHKHDCDVHASAGPLLLIGDAFHNFVDGIVLASAFLHSTPLGITVALSTIAHEVPQEVGEFVVYLRGGYSRRRALTLNAITSLATLPGAVLGYLFLSHAKLLSAYLLVFAAAGFLYVALADLIPTQRGRSSLRVTIVDLVLMVCGVGVIALLAHRH